MVIDYIYDNMDKKLTLAELANKAMYSKYHFHRVFKILVGETLNAFVKRVKMERAHLHIHQNTTATISDHSVRFGYSSLANFSRDFRDYYGYSPSEAKANIDLPFKHAAITLDHPCISFIGERQVPTQMVIYKKVITGYQPQIILASYIELYQYITTKNYTIKQLVGLAHDNPEYTPANKCKYDVCIAISGKKMNLTNSCYSYKELKGGRYVIFDFVGERRHIISAWDYILKKWMINSRYRIDDRPYMNIFLQTEITKTTVVKANLCLPIR